MTSSDVVEIYSLLESRSKQCWIDGGWGVDALIGKQTRLHSDLDLAVSTDELDDIKRSLGEIGFDHDPAASPGLPARLVLLDHHGRQIDLHPLVFDRHGNGWQQLSNSGRAWGRYPVEDLQATGTIGGADVRCLSAELQVRFRLGHEWTEKDDHDLRLLAANFDVARLLPPPLW
jgi:lincosamide nucleotidyltransferase A/C/D/E